MKCITSGFNKQGSNQENYKRDTSAPPFTHGLENL
jgi:hypothetical protein